MNREKLLLLLLLYLTGSYIQHSKAQTNLKVKMQDETEQLYILSSLQKLTFVDNKLVLTSVTATESSFLLSSVDKIFFSTETSNSIEEPDDFNRYLSKVYPNPSSGVIYVNITDSEATDVFIYRLDGTLALVARVISPHQAIDVSQLPQGLYFIKIDNEVFKLRKI